MRNLFEGSGRGRGLARGGERERERGASKGERVDGKETQGE